MSDWPELDDTAEKRERDEEELRRNLRARCLVEEIEQEVAQKAWLADQLERNRYIFPALLQVIETFAVPVADLLHRLSVASWKLDADSMHRLKLETKLVFSDRSGSPRLCWEANRIAYYYNGWFITYLVLDSRGCPYRFKVTAAGEQELTAAPSLEALKAALLEAIQIGPLTALHRKAEPGILIDEKLLASLR